MAVVDVNISADLCRIEMLGAICGSAISMDLLAQSMDPYSAQKSMDVCAIYGFCVADLPIYRFFMPTLYLNLTFMN